MLTLDENGKTWLTVDFLIADDDGDEYLHSNMPSLGEMARLVSEMLRSRKAGAGIGKTEVRVSRYGKTFHSVELRARIDDAGLLMAAAMRTSEDPPSSTDEMLTRALVEPGWDGSELESMGLYMDRDDFRRGTCETEEMTAMMERHGLAAATGEATKGTRARRM